MTSWKKTDDAFLLWAQYLLEAEHAYRAILKGKHVKGIVLPGDIWQSTAATNADRVAYDRAMRKAKSMKISNRDLTAVAKVLNNKSYKYLTRLVRTLQMLKKGGAPPST